LKPSNVLVTARGVPKLLDFGIAKLLNPDLSAEAVAPTRFDLRAMTPEYASPEQIRGLPVTTATDVYSLGVMLYELVTGHRPYRFQNRTELEIARVVCEEEPERPSTAVTRVVQVASPEGGTETKLTPDGVSRTRGGPAPKLRRRLAGDVDNIVLMAMRKEPQRRYGSVEQFSEDIRRHLDGLPVIARADTVTYRLGKFVSRNRVATVAGVVTVAALVAGVVGVSWQAHRAELERARAERRFNDVRELANSFLFEFHDAIQDLPGSTPARALVVERAREYLDSLAAESEDDTALQLELGTAYAKVGVIQWNRYYSHLGDVPGALATQKRAHEIRSRVAASEPANLDARRDLARSEQLLGDILIEMGDVPSGLAHYRTALAVREHLAAETPGDREARFDVAVSYQRIGDTLGNPSFASNLGDREAALESYEAMQGIFQALALEDPKDAGMRHSLSIGYEKLGDMMRASRDFGAALAQYREGASIRARLADEDPTNVRYRRDLAVSYRKVGDMLELSGDSPGAAASYVEAVSLFREIAAADPSDANARADLSAAEGRLAEIRPQRR
jgi:non-specific serine/threonine protein kinase/serine/threonine-protein kinase